MYDGGRDFSSIQLMDRGIDATLRVALRDLVSRSSGRYMDLTRIGAPNYAGLLREFYRVEIRQQPAGRPHRRPQPSIGFPVDGWRSCCFQGTPIVPSGMALSTTARFRAAT